MVKYNLDHLTQDEDQKVFGPIQDDEALLLFSLIRTMRLRRLLEIGGLNGYSARNFLEAIGQNGILYTVDINPVRSQAANHRVLEKDALALVAEDVDAQPLDLVFFDCHAYDVQMSLLRSLAEKRLITDRTVLALHDTNLHPAPISDGAYPVEGGWVHQWVERRMVNALKEMGYDILVCDTEAGSHSNDLPFRHGLTIARRFTPLDVGTEEQMRQFDRAQPPTVVPQHGPAYFSAPERQGWHLRTHSLGHDNESGLWCDRQQNVQAALRDGAGRLRVVLNSNPVAPSFIEAGNLGVGTPDPRARLHVAGPGVLLRLDQQPVRGPMEPTHRLEINLGGRRFFVLLAEEGGS